MPEAIDDVKPAIEGWWDFDDSGLPYLTGSRCGLCGTYVFPPRATDCPNPACGGATLEAAALSRRGTVWSYTENHYAPPPPYPAPDPFEPFAVAAVALAHEGLIVLGKVVAGTRAADLAVGMEMELAIEPLYRDDDGAQRTVYAWSIA
ncbi:Zn-ribbon domain-containing OB-fold protein [Mycobacterium sp.]|uniref:Zn-ribbon domain-containing OB-fold protein n=1 Tax=Mycobacterium sp. TaxID=1785 RepID=UPI002B63227F|nr:OB-fold domain-containing protein [Mycobacterium sp.]HME49695.1 OB-fold domain-containing protein [Mycobacterium sp.]